MRLICRSLIPPAQADLNQRPTFSRMIWWNGPLALLVLVIGVWLTSRHNDLPKEREYVHSSSLPACGWRACGELAMRPLLRSIVIAFLPQLTEFPTQ